MRSAHEELIARLREIRNKPAIEALPPKKLSPIDSILREANAQARARTHVSDYLDRLQSNRALLRDARALTLPKGSQLQDLPAYKTWHAGAEKLLEQATAITANPKTYRACLNHTLQAWTQVHDSIRNLQRQLGHDTTSLRHQQPDLYLPPIVRGVPTLDEARQGDASYRRLRNNWNQHMDRAETNNAHPYEIKGYAAHDRDRPAAQQPTPPRHHRTERGRPDPRRARPCRRVPH